MKKTLRLIALSLVLIMTLALLASCGGPNKDPEKAEKALKENGYTVLHGDADDIGIEVKGIKNVLFGMDANIDFGNLSESKVNGITIIYFEDKAAANDAWEDVKDYAEKDDEYKDVVVKKSGAMIYFGTADAIKAAK